MQLSKISSLSYFFLATCLTALTLVGCSSKPQKNSTSSVATKTLIVGILEGPAGFDPAQYTALTDAIPSNPIFDRLVSFKRGTTTIVPSLATNWQRSKDGLIYTFYLRQGVKFHTTNYFKPTRDFNADDVVFTFSRVLDQKHPFRLAYPAEFPNFEDEDHNLIKVVKIDPYTVQFVLRKPQAILGDLAASSSSILSEEYAKQLMQKGKASEIAQKPIGTGPFILKQHLKNQQIRYVANKNYWDKRPENQLKLDGLVMSIVPELTVQVKKLQAGECHLLEALPFLDIPKFQKDPNFVVHRKLALNIWYIAYNTQKPALKDKRVRQALDMAIDKESIVKVYHGFAQPLATAIPVIQWGHDPSIKAAPFNPTKAKQLLRKAGYPNGFNLKFLINLGKAPANDLIAQIIQNNWAKIGVKVKLISYDGGEFWRRAGKGEHDVMFMGGTGNNGDPGNFLISKTCQFIAIGTNLARWCHKPFDNLYDKGRYSLDHTEQVKIYKQAQQLIKEEVPFTPLSSKMDVHITHKSIKGYVIPLLTPQQYTGIWIE
jgi:dipeptide transport system substrate-binding protein